MDTLLILYTSVIASIFLGPTGTTVLVFLVNENLHIMMRLFYLCRKYTHFSMFWDAWFIFSRRDSSLSFVTFLVLMMLIISSAKAVFFTCRGLSSGAGRLVSILAHLLSP